MLAGRVKANGPYGWHAQSKDFSERVAEGFMRHRWSSSAADTKSWLVGERSYALQIFLRKGLVTPPRPERALTDEEMRGKKVFESDATQCARCHLPGPELTDRTAYEFDKVPPPAGFEEEEDRKFKTPSLLFVSGTAPYYHDGRVSTLEALIAGNNDRMGKTNQLSGADRTALIAYLKTL
jgi:cytochrome c peroxidase